MTLEFLTPATGDGAPPAVSPFAAIARRSGARLEVRRGWEVPAAFAEAASERDVAATTVAFADASALPKLEIHGPPDVLAGCAGGLVFGTATAHDQAWWCPLTSTRALVVGAEPDLSKVAALRSIDVTAQYCALRIEGPLTRQLMARFCALDLRLSVAPPGALRPGSVARCPGLVIVEDADRLLVLAGAAVAEYLWTVIADAAERLGGRPVGLDALASGSVRFEEAATGA